MKCYPVKMKHKYLKQWLLITTIDIKVAKWAQESLFILAFFAITIPTG